MSDETLESIVARYEQALSCSPETPLRDFVPPRDHADFFPVATELARVDLELSWATERRKSLDDYLRLIPEVMEDPVSFDAIAFEEYRLRRLSGEEVTPHDYQVRYNCRVWHWPVVRLSGSSVETIRRDEESAFATATGVAARPRDRTRMDVAARVDSGFFAGTPTVESTLRRRLRFIGLTLLLTLSYLALLAWLNPVAKVGLFLGSTWLQWLNGICVAVCAAVCAVLWRPQPIPLARLRVLEMVLFGAVVVELACGLFSDLFIDHELARPMREGEHELFHYASSWSLPFFALIVAYGILVPSGWRRCLIVVSIIGAIPVLVSTLAVIWLHSMTWSFFQSFLLQMIIWMVTAAAIALYGVHRLEKDILSAAGGKLGKYRLIRQIAAGGMGAVFEAEQSSLGRRCAIKIMHPRWSRHPELMVRFEREVQVLAAIAHPNVVQIHDFGATDEGIFFYVMEFLEGETLQHRIQEHGPMNWRTAARLTVQIADALTSVHQSGIVHRDVKPANIFLCRTSSGEVGKLLDFGLVKVVAVEDNDRQLTQEGAILGTPAYMSPEQAATSEVDSRTDIYSLGATAVFALTGRPVFDRQTIAEILSDHIRSRPEFLPEDDECPAALLEVIARCLSKDPHCRYQSGSELADALRAVLAG